MVSRGERSGGPVSGGVPQNGQNDGSPRPQQVKERGVALRYVERIEQSENDGGCVKSICRLLKQVLQRGRSR